jgi:multiple sugar transport system permease protein
MTTVVAPSTAATTAGRGRLRSAGTAGAMVATVALLPFVAFLLVFAVYPLINLVRLAVSNTAVQNAVFVSEFAGLSNFGRVLTDPAFWHSVLITTAFVVLTVGLTLVAGLALALLVDRAVVLHHLARNVLIWPAVITPVVVSVLWLLVLSPTVGGLNKLLRTFGLPEQSWLNSGPGAFMSVVAVDVWHWTPIVFLFLYTALKGIPSELFEAARVDGATERQILFQVTIPLLGPALVVVGLLRLVMSIKAFDEMFLLTGGGPNGATNLISLDIRSQFFDRLDFGYAAAESIVVVVATLIIVGSAVLIRRRSVGGAS